MAHTPISMPEMSPDTKPTVYIDLTKADISELKGVAIGDQVTVTITGKVCRLSMNEPEYSNTVGTITVETDDVEIDQADSPLAALLDADE